MYNTIIVRVPNLVYNPAEQIVHDPILGYIDLDKIEQLFRFQFGGEILFSDCIICIVTFGDIWIWI